MGRILLGIVIGAAGLFAYQRAHRPSLMMNPEPGPKMSLVEAKPEREAAGFRCDGRVYCSQMTSCDEAKYFLGHCPGVKMDGEGDGVPCERQWCTRD